MRYFASMADEGVVVRAAESRDDLQRPDEWREVPNLREFANERGVAALNSGKRMVFTARDQGWSRLCNLLLA